MSLEDIITHLAYTLCVQEKKQAASNLIGCEVDHDLQGRVDDLVMRGKILKYKADKMEITKLHKKLDALRSEQLKKNDMLDELEELLK